MDGRGVRVFPKDPNWEHEEVRADFCTTLRFWSDRGVDGFRVDVAHALVKDLAEPAVVWRATARSLPRPQLPEVS